MSASSKPDDKKVISTTMGLVRSTALTERGVHVPKAACAVEGTTARKLGAESLALRSSEANANLAPPRNSHWRLGQQRTKLESV